MNKLTIINENGLLKEVNLITFLTLDEFSKTYACYVEKDLSDGENEVLFARVNEMDGKTYFESIESNEELETLTKEFQKELNK